MMAAALRTVSIILSTSGTPRALRVPVYLLRVLNGPDARKQKRVALGRLRIGSDENADFQLSDPAVSALHCEIVSDERGFRVRDLGAKNGVVVAGRRVESAWLEPQDEIVLGATSLRFKLLDEDEEHALSQRTAFGRLRGASFRMRELYGQLAKAAENDSTVLLTGETGTGKELAAEALVFEGHRRKAAFEVVDCARLPPALAESELFGHEKYAFTGATTQHIGAFERAKGGTIFLDEIGELPRDLQPKLLGVLERREVQRLGGHERIPLNLRVIAATHRDLEREVNRGTFRADLYYRLAVTEIRLPALRDRREDVPTLVQHFLEELPGSKPLPPLVLQRLGDADYPGNVRELRNAVERAALGLDFASARAPAAVDTESPYHAQRERLLADFDRAYFAKLLEACKGNVSEASRRSGINRVHLYKILARAGLSR
jgi:two-component system, NtrC family, response regulator GlrR